MLKTFLCVLAVAVLLDAAAFEGHYRQEVVGSVLDIGRQIVTQDWKLTH